MCYYMGCRVSKAEYIRLLGIEKEIKNLQLNRKVQKGFDYRDWPIIKPINNGKDFEIKNVHWEYIPEFICDEVQLKDARIMQTWLNAKAENLFVNEKGKRSMWYEGAMQGRCLALCSYFYEFQHVPKIGKRKKVLKTTEKIPYLIKMADDSELFFMAAISRLWTNETRGQSAETFALVTTKANSIMSRIHNDKFRMPTILPLELAEEWLQPGLSKKRIQEIASYQFPAEKMKAWTVEKFLSEMPEDPTKEVIYENAIAE
jgi:putative SOS response-associated peptidase YedK